MLLGIPPSYTGVPGLKSQLHFQSRFLLVCILEDSRWWVKYLELSHPCVRSLMGFLAPASGLAQPSCCGLFVSESVIGRPLCLCFSAFQKKKRLFCCKNFEIHAQLFIIHICMNFSRPLVYMDFNLSFVGTKINLSVNSIFCEHEMPSHVSMALATRAEHGVQLTPWFGRGLFPVFLWSILI